jgi:putative hemolysin
MMASFKRLEVRLAQDDEEVRQAQALRYKVFYEELGARPTPELRRLQRDIDALDERCDHLLVIDNAASDLSRRVVGTYRLNLGGRGDDAAKFYSSDEYDLRPLLNWPGRLLEVGRSCVAADYRRGLVMQKLWTGIAGYMEEHDVSVMFGCASFPGVNPKDHAQALSYLYHHRLAPSGLRAAALPARRVDMAILEDGEYDPEEAQAELPPLIKGYLRLGGAIGDGAVIDYQFNTVDVCVVVNAREIVSRYQRFCTSQADSRKAA